MPRRIRSIVVGMTAVVLIAASVRLAQASTEVSRRATESIDVPSMTIWGKVFSALLFAALGVAYMVWRRPVIEAAAILETSPLGSGRREQPMVDRNLFVRTVVIVDAIVVVSLCAMREAEVALTTIDAIGALVSGAIVAFIVHLLILARGGRGHGV